MENYTATQFAIYNHDSVGSETLSEMISSEDEEIKTILLVPCSIDNVFDSNTFESTNEDVDMLIFE